MADLTGVAKRFFVKVKHVASGCHEWQGHIQPNGYGQFSYLGTACYAHRVAYLLANSVDPGDEHVLHSCDNRKCVNPEHLWIGSREDNMRDMVSKGRQAAGTKNFHAKLKPEQVHAIRAAIGTHREIASAFNCSQPLVSMIRSGKIWRTV